MEVTPQLINRQTVVECFLHIHDPMSTAQIRKRADIFLIDAQRHFLQLLKVLIEVYENQQNIYIRHQALICMGNVIKRNWNNKRLLKTQKEFPQLRKALSQKIIAYIYQNEKNLMKSIYDIAKFIAKSDYPHGFQEFTQYVLNICQKVAIDSEGVYHFKQIKQIFLELADKKGFSSRKNFESNLRPIMNKVGSLSESFREGLSKSQKIDGNMAKLSKYCDQILICIMRMGPYELLDDESFLMGSKHVCQKLQTLLNIHSEKTSSNEKSNLEKNIKSIIYQLGQLQLANPFALSPIISQYFNILSYVISKPNIFAKSTTLKYSLLSMRKFIKQFSYFAQGGLFMSSISSKPKSQNYLDLRQICHTTYENVLNTSTIQGLMNFLLTVIMNLKSKNDDETISFGFDEGFGYDKSSEKQLSVHICGTLLVEALMQRFTGFTIDLIFKLVASCMSNKWVNIDIPTQINLFSALTVLPKTCKKEQISNLYQFPIIDILYYVHGNQDLREKFPHLISGWLQIFSNEQIGSLINALLDFVQNQGNAEMTSKGMQLLLYSCYSLNKIITIRSGAVDSGNALKKVFPIAILIFTKTDNPELLWPLVNLISTLITKCQFDTNIIINSIETNSLNKLITNESEVLNEALCDMLKNFLCVIPRNKPAQAVFQLVYHFLNHHLQKTQSNIHEKIVNLWYISVRQFSSVNDCSRQYYELFQNHFKRCIFRKNSTILYILEEYMLIKLIQQKLEDLVEIVYECYQEAEELDKEEGKNLKIAALSFQITLITEYNLEKVNSQKLLFAILKDFCTFDNQISITIHNSLLSIVNRYIIMHKDAFFKYLQSINLNKQFFFESYFKNMDYLTSRTATKINSLALISLLNYVDQETIQKYFIEMIKKIIPEVQNYVMSKQTNGIQFFIGKVQNSPSLRFATNILSERKDLVRKKGTFDDIELKNYFIKQFYLLLQKLGTNIEIVASNLPQGDWSHRLLTICRG